MPPSERIRAPSARELGSSPKISVALLLWIVSGVPPRSVGRTASSSGANAEGAGSGWADRPTRPDRRCRSPRRSARAAGPGRRIVAHRPGQGRVIFTQLARRGRSGVGDLTDQAADAEERGDGAGRRVVDVVRLPVRGSLADRRAGRLGALPVLLEGGGGGVAVAGDAGVDDGRWRLWSAGAGPTTETVRPLALRSVEPIDQPAGSAWSAGIGPHAADRQAVRSRAAADDHEGDGARGEDEREEGQPRCGVGEAIPIVAGRPRRQRGGCPRPGRARSVGSRFDAGWFVGWASGLTVRTAAESRLRWSDRGRRAGEMVGAAGFEPTTLSSRTIRATKLRHAPTGCPLSQGARMVAEDRSDPTRSVRAGVPDPVAAPGRFADRHDGERRSMNDAAISPPWATDRSQGVTSGLVGVSRRGSPGTGRARSASIECRRIAAGRGCGRHVAPARRSGIVGGPLINLFRSPWIRLPPRPPSR